MRDLAAVSWGEDRIDLFWTEDGGGLRHRASIAGSWAEAEDLGGRLASPVAVTAWAPDRMEVFAVFADGELWDRYWDGSSWHPWESLGGSLALGSAPAASSWGDDRLDVFATGGGRRDLAPLVGRDALGGLGAPRTLTGPTASGRPGRPLPARRPAGRPDHRVARPGRGAGCA
jgi:hypothetical protein